MNRRTGTTHITQLHIAITIISFAIFAPTALFSSPKRSRHQEMALQQSPPSSPTHKRTHTPSTDPTALKSLLETAPQPFLTDHGEKLLHAIDLFHDVPGFQSTLKKALNQARQSPLAHGYLYEIETALCAQEKYKDRVCAFGKEHSGTSETGSHEIDVETQRYHIECKDIFWDSRRLQKDPESIQQQLREQRSIVEEENQRAIAPKTFLLCSKQPIPDYWKEWLKEEGIAYDCPDNASCSESSANQTSHS